MATGKPERMRRVLKIKPTIQQFLNIRSKSRFNQFKGHVGFGLRSGIPLCCCLEWTTRVLLEQKEFGIKLCGPDCYVEYVHCAYHRWRYKAEHERKRTFTDRDGVTYDAS